MFKKALLVGTLLIAASNALVNCRSDISVSIQPRVGVKSWDEGLITKTLLDIDIKANTCSLVDLKLALNVPIGCVISSSWNLQLDGLSATVSPSGNKPGLILGCPTKATPTVTLTVSLAQCSSACSTKAPTPAPTKAPTPAPTKAPTPAPTKAPTPAPTKAPTPAPTKAPTPAPTTAPTPAPTKAAKTNEVAKFDDINTQVAVGLTKVPEPYHKLSFPGFSVLKTANTGATPGIYPESGDQYAVSEARTTLLQGQATITSVYAGSKVTSFDLNSLYLGCALITGNGATSTPQECEVFISGYKMDNTREVYQATFTPPSPLASTGLQLVKLPNSFSNLVTVKFTYVFPSGLNVLDGLLGMAIDTVKYSVTLN